MEWVQEVPVLVLALARPELREIRPDLVTVSRWVTEAIHLGGLDAGATAELAAEVLGAARLPDELLRRLPSSTGGNPLFVRELIGMLAHDGVLVAAAGRLAAHDRRRRHRHPTDDPRAPGVAAGAARRRRSAGARDRVGGRQRLLAGRRVAHSPNGVRRRSNGPSTDCVGSSSLSPAGRISATSRYGASTTS